MTSQLPYVCACLLILSYPSPNTATIQTSYSEGFLFGIHQFTNDFYKVLDKKTDGNFISSPISTLTVLAELANGADGNSKDELIKAIHLPITRDNILDNYQQYLKNLNEASGVESYVASKIFARDSFEIYPAFKNVTKSIFDSEAESIDFSKTQEAAQKINKWAQDHTNNKIDDLIKPDDLTRTVLMLLNAVYFKGSWVYSFSSELKEKPFYLSASKSISVPMMCNKAQYNQGPLFNGLAAYIELPYEVNGSENKFSFYSIVPAAPDGYAAVKDKLAEIDYAALNSETAKPNFTFCMPKFKIESNFDLIPVLQDLGIHDVFKDIANLSKIGPYDNLKVTKVVQKAFLSVDEKGTEAAITTGLSVSMRTMKNQLDLDKVSLFAIVSKATNTPIFYGRLSNPQSQSA